LDESSDSENRGKENAPSARRHDMNIIANLRLLGATLLVSMCKLNEIQFSAPWNPARSRCGASGL
jgi:hypothetical protein